ncbi:C40 family peptidase [Hymenobacter yonginensis]|uniref:C40 family peptidase n=1 Tax=Hymenobacter yonginensis TaxID=748197 RepID=A0ABY7PSN6_9BACT|nr:C40 family peptidase [Hymenobacter yonginensis]WBO85901.1 C40 family peptidase [Hymenobacter yonginensis]
MRYVWICFLVLAALLVGYFAGTSRPASAPGPSQQSNLPTHQVALVTGTRPTPDSVVAFAMRQLGTNYCYAGSTPATGFDCSGFVQYVFQEFRVAMPHSTALLIAVGRPVTREQARRGDIVVFTGTAPGAATPGHAGIVVSEPGQPLKFIHSSSARRESGVKISQVEGTDYERRFMQVRRVL